MNPDRRTLGAYYSPEPYARALLRWALNGTSKKVMDPSFGGCAFLRVALDELVQLGVEAPELLIHGTDIDGDTAQWASHLISAGVPESNLLAKDFLTLSPGTDLPLVGAVVGNPPYVRHHRLTPDAIASASGAMERAGVTLNGRANLWAYFVVHATNFVEHGGRMALLLPGSVLHAEYAQPVLKYLAERFGEVLMVRIGERVFEDAQEETVVLLASRAGEPSDKIRTMECAGLKELEEILKEKSATFLSSELEADWKLSILDSAGRELFDSLLDRSSSLKALGEIAEIKIGTVTGANEFFVTTPHDMHLLAVDEHSIDIVPRSAWLTSSTFSPEQLQLKSAAGLKTKLLALPADLSISNFPELSERIRDAEKRGVHLRAKCNRDPWWALGAIPIPDAFLPYMGAHHRGLVANSSRSASTNAIHQVTWRLGTPEDSKCAAVTSSWSSITALSAELFGRSYGGGVLKIEPSAAKRLLVLATTSNIFSAVKGRSARETADLAMADALALSPREQEVIGRNLRKLSARRSLRVRSARVAKPETRVI